MAIYRCSISGLQIACEHLSFRLKIGVAVHPVFYLPLDRLAGLYNSWLKGELSETESLLVYLAFLKASKLVEFKTPVQITEFTHGMITSNMSACVKICTELAECVTAKSLEDNDFPTVVINEQSSKLSNSLVWFRLWEDALEEYATKYRNANRDRANSVGLAIERKEQLISDCLADPNKPITRYITHIAQWAAVVSNFPETGQIVNKAVFGDTIITKRDYWIWLIKQAARPTDIFTTERDHLGELITHIEDHVGELSKFSHILLALLRQRVKDQRSFLAYGDDDGNSGKDYTVLDPKAGGESATLINLMQTAPDVKPDRANFAKYTDYLVAQAKYAAKRALLSANVSIKGDML